MDERTTFSFRASRSLMARVDDYARASEWSSVQAGLRGGDHKGKDSGRSALIVGLLEALVEGRVSVADREGVNPFPAEERRAGESPEFPALIAYPPSPTTKE